MRATTTLFITRGGEKKNVAPQEFLTWDGSRIAVSGCAGRSRMHATEACHEMCDGSSLDCGKGDPQVIYFFKLNV